MQKIDFYFDFLSPYSYLAWNWVRCNSQKYLFNLIPCPLGSLIRHYETKGPAEIPPKRNYLFKNCLRHAKLMGINFNAPKQLPFNSLYALRMSLKENCGDDQFKVVDTIFTLGWDQGEDLGDEKIIVNELNKNGLKGDLLLENVGSGEIRQALKRNVSKAIGAGVFGVPTFIVDEEVFWGNDSIGHLKLFLDNKDPLERTKYNEFEKRNFTVF